MFATGAAAFATGAAAFATGAAAGAGVADFAAACAGAADFAPCATGSLLYAAFSCSSVGNQLPVFHRSRIKLVPTPNIAPAVHQPGAKDAPPAAASIADPV